MKGNALCCGHGFVTVLNFFLLANTLFVPFLLLFYSLLASCLPSQAKQNFALMYNEQCTISILIHVYLLLTQLWFTRLFLITELKRNFALIYEQSANILYHFYQKLN